MIRLLQPCRLALLAALAFAAALPADDVKDLVDANVRGMKLQDQQRFREAEAEFLKALRLAERIYPNGHPNTASTLNNLALLYVDLGRYVEAEPLYRRSLAIYEKARGPDHPDVALALTNLAVLYENQARFAEAEPLLRRGLKIREKAYGPDHTEVAFSLKDLASLLQSQGKPAEAEPLLRRSLRIREAAHGADHPDVATTLNSLALVAADLGQYREAEALSRRSLAIYERANGPDHPHTAAALTNLASLYADQGRYAEAEPLVRRGLAIREKVYGPDHPDVANSLGCLAGLCSDQGRYTEAGQLHRRSLEIVEKAHGPDHTDTAHALGNLAVWYRKQGRYAEAEPLLQRSLKIMTKVFGPDNPATATAIQDLGELGADQGKYEEAVPLYRRVIAIREKAYGTEHPEVASALGSLAYACANLKRYDEAEALHRRSLKIRETVRGPEHPTVAISLCNLACLYYWRGRYDEAKPLFQRSLTIFEKVHGPEHSTVSTLLNNLANLAQAQGQYDEAERLHLRGLRICEKALSLDHPDVARSLFNLAKLYAAQGKFAEAVPFAERLRRATRNFLLRELPYLSPAEQQDFLQAAEAEHFPAALSLGRQLARDLAVVARSAEWLLNGKAVAIEAQTVRLLLERDADSAGDRTTLTGLQAIRAREAALAHRIGPGSEGLEQTRRDLAARRQELEKALARRGGAAAALRQPWVELGEVRKSIPASDLLIDIARFRPARFAAKPDEAQADAPRYVAWLVPSAGSGTVVLVDLGEAAAIDAAVRAVREAVARGPERAGAVGEPQAAREVAADLQRLADLILRPLRPYLKNVTALILSPDGDLWLAPWAALPVGDNRFLVEEFTLRFVISGRDLLAPATARKPDTSAALVLADPDFDAVPAGAVSLAGRHAPSKLGDATVHFSFAEGGGFVVRSGGPRGEVIGRGNWKQNGDVVVMETERSAYSGHVSGHRLTGTRRFKSQPGEDRWSAELTAEEAVWSATRSVTQEVGRLGRVQRLPGTAAEAEAAAPKLRLLTRADVTVLTDTQATEVAFKAVVRPKVLVVASHGFFLPAQDVKVGERDRLGGDHRPSAVRARDGSELESPLVRCGLLLAGCNRRGEAQDGQDDGVLTGLEVVGTDLRGTELVVLSACETGLGDVNVGEGVAGLRQAFQLAGAESVVASLWRIPDRDTTRLMATFFDGLASGKGRSEALCAAQRRMIEGRRKQNGAAHPYYWAAFTLTGRAE